MGLVCTAVLILLPLIFLAAGVTASWHVIVGWAICTLLLCVILLPRSIHMTFMTIRVQIDSNACVSVQRSSRIRNEIASCLNPCFHVSPIRWGLKRHGCGLVLSTDGMLECVMAVTQDREQILRVVADILEHAPAARVEYEESELHIRLTS